MTGLDGHRGDRRCPMAGGDGPAVGLGRHQVERFQGRVPGPEVAELGDPTFPPYGRFETPAPTEIPCHPTEFGSGPEGALVRRRRTKKRSTRANRRNVSSSPQVSPSHVTAPNRLDPATRGSRCTRAAPAATRSFPGGQMHSGAVTSIPTPCRSQRQRGDIPRAGKLNRPARFPSR